MDQIQSITFVLPPSEAASVVRRVKNAKCFMYVSGYHDVVEVPTTKTALIKVIREDFSAGLQVRITDNEYVRLDRADSDRGDNVTVVLDGDAGKS